MNMKNIGDKFKKNKMKENEIVFLKNIEEAEIKKANLLLDMGIMTYEKIRREEILDDSFDDISNKILEIDKIIYSNKIMIKNIENRSKEFVCECGNKLNIENKFCGSCGKKIAKEEINLIECERCNQLNEEDSSYCGCCGVKLKNEE